MTTEKSGGGYVEDKYIIYTGNATRVILNEHTCFSVHKKVMVVYFGDLGIPGGELEGLTSS